MAQWDAEATALPTNPLLISWVILREEQLSDDTELLTGHLCWWPLSGPPVLVSTG
jgi:hypothetical protein